MSEPQKPTAILTELRRDVEGVLRQGDAKIRSSCKITMAKLDALVAKYAAKEHQLEIWEHKYNQYANLDARMERLKELDQMIEAKNKIVRQDNRARQQIDP